MLEAPVRLGTILTTCRRCSVFEPCVLVASETATLTDELGRPTWLTKPLCRRCADYAVQLPTAAIVGPLEPTGGWDG